MAKLIAKSSAGDALPVTIGGLTLSEEAPAAITCIAPFNGQQVAVSKALKQAIGAEFPAPNRATGKAGARVVWSGLGQAMVLGAPVQIDGAACSDQSDGWTCLSLKGVQARAVLARLTPLDLRPDIFKRGHAARSLLGHMNAIFLRSGAERYDMLVFRSMTHTAVHELTEAMTSVQAQT